jgi:hypothetical protein
LHFNRCLTTEYSETTAHFNGNFDTDNQIYVPPVPVAARLLAIVGSNPTGGLDVYLL